MFLSVMGLGTLLSVSSIHWLGIWAGLEINLIGFLPMLVYQKSISESESAVKYFIVQALGSSFLILGSLMTFNMSFTWDVVSKMWLSGDLGLIVIMMGLYKISSFPFHYWLPGVMAGLPWSSCLLLATWQKLAPLFLVLCLLELNQSYLMGLVLCLVSVGSSLIGGLGGMNQTQIRALLAYSSIGHLGWMAFAAMHSEWVMKAYLGIYILISLSMFLSLWYSDSGLMKHINNLKSNSSLQLSIMLLLLSLGGLPPLLGFISKWLVVMSISISPWLSFVFLLILGSLMSLFYYLSLFFSMFLSGLKKNGMKMNYISNKGIIIINILNVFGGSLILISGLLNFL
ncbi:NADH dehydrogenase subunit 2 (mitochondrion) [Babylonia areolata]|uniref:NADH-ubiquinone oxidoreductase chain 2 n=1 Tax=Babylonia areolata TaxID=304850 RepID=V5IU94_BABAR|nr:NADH dehydrogenase subunit 2 [Babylonia areolata]ADQ12918.1 NADH dehydrogenase subunit 2 [Babylonia areolata]